MNTGGLLVDTNLLVLFAVGRVNRRRIETFKRTNRYTQADYDLLVRVLSKFSPLYTVAHVLAEVSNLTDLPGAELEQARGVLKEAILRLQEAEIASSQAACDALFPSHGLADAAIGIAARKHNCTVLTDDLDLYLRLSRDRVKIMNFVHLRAQNWGV